MEVKITALAPVTIIVMLLLMLKWLSVYVLLLLLLPCAAGALSAVSMTLMTGIAVLAPLRSADHHFSWPGSRRRNCG
jgi:hypothetical protein